jgi:hypothetical protein
MISPRPDTETSGLPGLLEDFGVERCPHCKWGIVVLPDLDAISVASNPFDGSIRPQRKSGLAPNPVTPRKNGDPGAIRTRDPQLRRLKSKSE